MSRRSPIPGFRWDDLQCWYARGQVVFFWGTDCRSWILYRVGSDGQQVGDTIYAPNAARLREVADLITKENPA